MSSTSNSTSKLKLERYLILAVKRGRISLVKRLIDICKVNGGCVDEYGRTCLHLAIEAPRNGIDIMKLLLKRGININTGVSHGQACQQDYMPPLVWAIELRRRKAAKFLIRAGADVNARFRQRTVLQTAVELSCEVSLIRLLLDSGAVPGSILVTAYKSKSSVELIKLILDRVPILSDTIGYKALVAALREHWNVEAIKLLIDRPEVDPLRLSVTHQTSLHQAILSRHDNPFVLRLLLKRGVKIDAVDKRDHMTALHLALHRGKSNMARELICSGADVNVKTGSEKVSPLYWAVCTPNPCNAETIGLLISRGADLHATTRSGQTALHSACRYNNEDNVRVLLINGADPLVKDELGRTAFQSLPDLDSGAARQMVRSLTAIALANKRQIDHEDLKLVMQTPRLHEYRDQCAVEIHRMRDLKVYQDFTLLRLQFILSEDRLAKLLSNEDFLSSLKSKLFNNPFPLYEDFIFSKIDRAEEKMRTRCAMKKHLQDVFVPYLCIPELVLDHVICNYLTVDDLPGCQV